MKQVVRGVEIEWCRHCDVALDDCRYHQPVAEHPLCAFYREARAFFENFEIRFSTGPVDPSLLMFWHGTNAGTQYANGLIILQPTPVYVCVTALEELLRDAVRVASELRRQP